MTITKSVNLQYNESKTNFNNCFKSENNIEQNDVNDYKACITYAKNIDSLKVFFKIEEILHSVTFEQNLVALAELLCEFLKKCELNDKYLKSSLDKLKILSQNFENVRYDISEIEKKVSNLKVEFQDMIKMNKFKDCSVNVQLLRNTAVQLEIHLNENIIKNAEKEMKASFLNKFNTHLDKLKEIFQKDILENCEIDNINLFISLLNSAEEEFRCCNDYKTEIDALTKQFIHELNIYLDRLSSKINEMFKKENGKCLSKLEENFKMIFMLHSSSQLKKFTTEAYFCILETICGFIDRIKREICDIMSLLKSFDCKYERLHI